MTVELTATQVVAGLGVLLALVTVWRSGSRRGRAVAERTRSGVRLLSLTGRVVGTAGAIVGAQWVVILYGRESAALWVALGLPALFAGYTLTKALTVTGEQRERRR